MIINAYILNQNRNVIENFSLFLKMKDLLLNNHIKKRNSKPFDAKENKLSAILAIGRHKYSPKVLVW